MFKLSLRTKKEEGKASLFTHIRIGGCPQWINLLLKVDIVKWTDISSSPRKLQNFLDKSGYGLKLMDIEFGMKELKRQGNFTKENVEILIQDIVLKEKREEMEEQTQLGKEAQKRKMGSIERYINNFVQQMESGEQRSIKGELYAKQTIKAWKQFQRIFLDFYNLQPFSWNDIDPYLINKFITYLENKQYNKKTIGKYLRTLKQVIIDAEKKELHTNNTAKYHIRIPKVNESQKTKEIYLSKEELQGLYDMKLDGTEEIARDLFLVGCYTAQRYSDFSTINESCIDKTDGGTPVIRLEQEKTSNPVVIPIIDEHLNALLNKYNYNLPHLTDQEMNRSLKEIARKLSTTITSLAEKERTILKKQEKLAEQRGTAHFERDKFGNVLKPRWQLVTTHTARRTGITLMYLSGKYKTKDMMSISGHKDERTFMDYVKLSLDERAELVAKLGVDGLF